MSCPHNSWLELYNSNGASHVAYGSRLKQLTRELPQPLSVFPQLVFLMGRRQKDRALRQLCRSKYRKREKGISLRSDNRTLHCLHPRFFADCDPTCRELPERRETIPNCHPETVFTLESCPDKNLFQDVILTKLLFLFTDVVCIFADDVGGLDSVCQLLETWTKIGTASGLPAAVRPRVIIIESHMNPDDTSLVKEDLLIQLTACGKPFFEVFNDLEIFCLPPDGHSPDALFRGLGRELTYQLQNARAVRERHNSMFNATHLNGFFELALRHIPHLPQPFDFVVSARQSRPLDGALVYHISRFTSAANKARLPYEGIASHIASAILMDAYPRGMHQFSPVTVFRSLYQRPCITALRTCYSTETLANLQCQRIEHFLAELFQAMVTDAAPAHHIHRQNIARYQGYWIPVRSTKTCFWCLRRDPEHPQGCGHMICDACVETFGKKAYQTNHEYTVVECILCGKSSQLVVRLKPPTAAPRILSIDGGGPRGVIPLENLEILQEIVGPELAVPDFFDLYMGTSSGGIISLTLAILWMSIADSKSLFKELARKVFSKNLRKHFLTAWLTDEAYDSSAFDDTLKAHFGSTRRLFDKPVSNISSRKVAVTVSSIKGGEPCIFANYNGGAPHGKVYERLDPTNDPLVWEVYFSTATFFELGTFQDGGMSGHNCPIELAMLESKRIWRTVPEPDVVLSLGTGYETSGQNRHVTRFRNFLVDGFVPRCFRSAMESTVGQKIWSLFESKIPKESRWRYFRFDPSFTTPLPPMGNTDCMDSLSDWVRTSSEDWEAYRSASRALLTSCLYFQLEAEPEYQAGQYLCVGTIQTRAPAQPLIRRLVMESEELSFYKDSLNLGLSLGPDNICKICDQYSLPVRFFVRDLGDRVTLSLRVGRHSCPLSNFPNSMQWFVEEQMLSCPFVPQLSASACTCKDRGRRKRKYMEI
ncbi:FabD/lysophospholipase-like protein [Aspergillus tetrazonus]